MNADCLSPGGRSSGDQSGSGYDTSGSGPPDRSRRKKLAGYLRAANELRQNYQAQLPGRRERSDSVELPAIPGSFPDVSIATHGHEQLVLFPS
jgi:hypothetical protein